MVLEITGLAYDIKTKESITFEKLGSSDFWRVANSALMKGKSATPQLFYSAAQGCCLLHLIKQNCLLKPLKNSNLNESVISLPIFSSRIDLKLHNISRTTKMVKKVIMNFESSMTSDPTCISMVFPKNSVPELSYILAELLNMCIKESCFSDCWKVSLVFPVFKDVGESSIAKNLSFWSTFCG